MARASVSVSVADFRNQFPEFASTADNQVQLALN